MIRAVITMASLVLLAGCQSDRAPEASAAVGVGYQVDRLFTHDGCTVYRFVDSSYNRYFTRCDGAASSEVSWSESHQCGKTQCQRPVSVPTARGKGQP